MTRSKRAAASALIALCGVFFCDPVADARAQEGSASARQRQQQRRRQPQRQPRPAAAAGDEKARELVAEGDRLTDEGRWEEAIRAYNRALALDPRSAGALVGLGDAHMGAGRYAEGFDAYRRATAAAPWSPDTHYSLGAAYNDMAQYGDAFKHFVQAARLDPDFAEAHYGIGYAYLKLENYKDALPYLRQAVRLKPDYAEARLALGQTHLGLRDVKSAEAELKALAGLDAGAARDLEKEIRAGGGAAPSAPKSRLVDTLVYPDASLGPAREERAAAKSTLPPPLTAERPASPAAKPSRPTARQKGPADSAPALAVELSFWESVKDSADPEEFAAYLRKYPEGQFAELARIRLRALSGREGGGTTKAEAGARQEAAGVSGLQTSGEESAPERPAATATAQPSAAPPAQPLTDAAAKPVKEPPSDETPASGQPAAVGERPAEGKPEATPPAGAAPPATVEAALGLVRARLPSKFSYTVTASGGDSGGATSTSEVEVNYEPLKFEGCTVEWRDRNDALWVTLSDLDPEAVKVAPRARPGATLSAEVWDVSISAKGGRGAISEAKGDGSGVVNRYNGLDLQYDSREKAERLAESLRHAIRLCAAAQP